MTIETDANQHFESLYREHHPWLKSWLNSRLGCGELARDLAHDTFTRVLAQRRAGELHSPRAYLSSVARNLMVDLFRRRSLEQAYLDVLASQPEPVTVSLETHHSIIETLMEIDRLLDGLGERCRDIFLMAQLDGFSFVEISRRQGLSVNTVRKYFIRAMTHCLLAADVTGDG